MKTIAKLTLSPIFFDVNIDENYLYLTATTDSGVNIPEKIPRASICASMIRDTSAELTRQVVVNSLTSEISDLILQAIEESEKL